MSMLPTSEHWRKHLNKGAAQERVQALHDGNRLAIHVIESIDRDKLYPDRTLALLRSNESVLLGQHTRPLEKKDVALLSMSLPSSPASGKSIDLYKAGLHLGDELAYGFNVDEHQPYPARVIRVFRFNGNTSDKPHDKQFHLGGGYNCQEMAELYEPFEAKIGTRDVDLLNGVFKDASLSGRQLDLLRKYLEEPTAERNLAHNEALVAAAPRHAETILIPVRGHKGIPHRVVAPVCTFAGALSGIEHARKGMPLPVMLYHVDGPQLGKCTYVAQGEEECRAAALDAVRTLDKLGPFHVGHINEPLRKHGERLLGLDVYQPLDAQGIPSAAHRR